MLRTLPFIFVSLIFSISLANACSEGEICVGARFMNTLGQTGVIKELFADGRATVDFDHVSGPYTQRTSEMGILVRCHEDLCTDMRVNYGSSFGTAKEVYTNGKFMIEYDHISGRYPLVISTVGRKTKCVGNVCTNSRFINKSNRTGVVKEVFLNGIARIEYDQVSGTFAQVVSDLTVSGGPTPQQEEATTNITLPDQTQIMLGQEIFISGGERCGAPVSQVSGIQCWVCQERKSHNDRMLDPGTAHEPRIMIIKSSIRPAANEISFEITDDPSIREIRCISRSSRFNIKSRKELSEILEKNGLKLLIPAPLKE